jgi:urocanate hydratase
MLTLEEQERRAYISGNTQLAAALGAQIDVNDKAIEEASHDARYWKEECESAQEALEDAEEAAAKAEASLADVIEVAQTLI